LLIFVNILHCVNPFGAPSSLYTQLTEELSSAFELPDFDSKASVSNK